MNITRDTNIPTPPGASMDAVVCPFCALLCDDVSLPLHNLRPQTAGLGCAKARAGFDLALARGTPAPAVRGESVDWATALKHAHGLLRGAQFPLFHGLLGDLLDSKAAWSMAAHFGGVVDHRDGAMVARNLAVYQDSGWMVTSLGETRNRADLIIRVGEGIEAALPRLRERLLEVPERLHAAQPPRDFNLGIDGLDVLNELRMLWRGRTLRDPAAHSTELHRLLLDSAYPVFVIGPPAGTRGELALRAAAELVREINETRRAALLVLSTGLGDVTAQHSGAWHNGFGIRTSLARGYPEQDLQRFDGQRLLDRGEADLLVWISTLSASPPPPIAQPQIVIAHPATQFDQRPPEVFLPVAVPGVHRAGLLHRADGLGMLPLRRLVETDLPSTTTICRRLLDGVAGEE